MYPASKEHSFWKEFNQLAASNSIVIDRPQGSTHPRFPEMIYPLDYGYLDNTSAGDGNGIDVWIGSSNREVLTGILCTFDTLKRDAEIKILIGCTQEDVVIIRNFYSEILTLFISNPWRMYELP